MRMDVGYEYGEYCEEQRATNRVISAVFRADGAFSQLALAVEALGQPTV